MNLAVLVLNNFVNFSFSYVKLAIMIDGNVAIFKCIFKFFSYHELCFSIFNISKYIKLSTVCHIADIFVSRVGSEVLFKIVVSIDLFLSLFKDHDIC